MTELSVTGIEIDLMANTLRLVLAESPDDADRTSHREQPASIDVGAGGRLIGVVLDNIYIPVMEPEPGTETLVRSADLEIATTFDTDSGSLLAMIIPRRGEGYEITYPSGNQ